MTEKKLAIADTKIKLRHKETYVTEGTNERALAFPRGVYRGFIPRKSSTANTSVWLAVDPLSPTPPPPKLYEDSFAIYAEYKDATNNGWALSVREYADVEIDVSTLLPITAPGSSYLYVYITADYEIGTTTTAHYVVSDEDPYDSLSSNYDLDVIMIGRIPVSNRDSTITFDITNPATLTDVLAVTKYPTPTADKTGLTLSAGDNALGFMNSIQAWKLPSVNQKEAMDNANSPDSSNPFMTQDDVERYVADPAYFDKSILASGAGNTFTLTGDIYIGKGTLQEAISYFRIVDSTGQKASFSDGGDIRITDIKDSGGAASLNPSVDADSEGFYTDPILVVTTTSELPASTTVGATIWYAQKKTLLNFLQAPVKKTPVEIGVHASDVSVKTREYPPGWSGGKNLNDIENRVHRSIRGTNHFFKTDAHIAGRSNWLQTIPDAIVGNSPIVTTMGVRCLLTTRTQDDGSLLLIFLTGDADLVILKHDPSSHSSVSYASYLKDFVFALPGTGKVDLTVVPPFALTSPLHAWYATGMCCDGQNLYVRFRDTTWTGSSGSEYQVVMAFTIDDDGMGISPNSGWYASNPAGLSLGTGGAWGAQEQFTYGDDIIVADDDHVAVCCSWVDIGTGAADPTLHAIGIIDKSNGAIVYGSGDFGGSVSGGLYSVGPMVSDGVDVYCCATDDRDAADPNMQYVFRVSVSNPQSYSVASWTSVPRTLTSTVEAFVTGMEFDGRALWILCNDVGTDSALVIADTNTVVDGICAIYDVGGGNCEKIGGTCFDGKNMWVCRDPYSGSLRDRPFLDRLSVARVSRLADGSFQTGTTSSGSEIYNSLVVESVKVMSEYVTTGCNTWTVNRPCFDGETIWFSPESVLVAGNDYGKIFRISLVKSRG